MKQRVRAFVFLSAAALTISVLTPGFAYAVDNAAMRAIGTKTTGKATLHRDASGRVTHLRSATTPLAADPLLPPDARARLVLNQYRDAFLDPSAPLDLVTTRVAPPDASGRSHVRYQQRVNGIPVRGGNVIVHLDNRGVTAVHSKLHSNLNGVVTTPSINSAQALASAEHSIGMLYQKSRLNYTTPRLEIVNPDQLRGKDGGESRLAWFTEIRAAGVREFVWIDAQHGDVSLHFSQVANAIGVSDFAGACSDVSIGTPAYSADNPAPAGSEAETALNYLGAAYNFFSTSYSYTGIDGTGTAPISAGVNVCDADTTYESSALKAAWAAPNMYFATSFATADDIVGHEYAHAIIDNTSGLLMNTPQSGALAEGLADVFGETIDQLQSVANDSADIKWAFGEDALGGALRNLMIPGDNSLPGKVTDSNFYCGTDTSIWTHRNGAVISHAFALLADGGTYNGFTMTGIGVKNAARIFFDTMTQHLTESSSFLDAYNGFKAAADLLVTSETITNSDRAQLVKVLDAVELNAAQCSTQLNYCPTGQTAASLFSDGFENPNSGNWTNAALSGINHWTDSGDPGAIGLGSPAAVYFPSDAYKGVDPVPEVDPDSGLVSALGIAPNRGNYALWGNSARGPSTARTGNSSVGMSNAVAIPAGARMQFESRIVFKPTPDTVGEDGGTIEYSIDNGSTWHNAGALIAGGQAYTGIIQGDAGNPLANEPAFVGAVGDYSYVSSQLDLISLSGMSAKFRFRIGTDQFDGTMGWQIDDVNIYTCTDAALIVSPTSGLSSSESGGSKTFTVRLGSAPSGSVTLKIESSNTGEGSVDKAELVFDSSNYSVDQMVTITGVDDSVNDGDVAYTVTVSVDQTNDTGYKSAPSIDVLVTNTNNDQSKRGGGGGSIGLSLLLALLLLTLARAMPCCAGIRYPYRNREKY